jgi:Tfp pilus assembly protein PilF
MEKDPQNQVLEAVKEDVIADESQVTPPPVRKKIQFRFRKHVAVLDRRLKSVNQFALRVLVFLAIVVGTLFVVLELSDDSYSIQKINVPARFSDAGYNNEVIAHRIAQKLTSILTAQRFTEEATQYSNAFDHRDVAVEVAGAGIPIRGVVDMLGTSLGLSRRKVITADVVEDGDTLIFTIKVGVNAAEKFTIMMNGSLEGAVEKIALRGSEMILKYSSPYLLARHYLYLDPEGNKKLASYLFDNFKADDKMQRVGYFALAGSYLTSRELVQAEETIVEGLSKYPSDINLNAAYGTILLDAGKHKEGLTQHKKVLSLIVPSTPLLRKTLCYNNVGTAYGLNGMFDSAMYFFEKAIVLDSQSPYAYINAGRAYLNLKGDTARAVEYTELSLQRGMHTEVLRRDPKLKDIAEIKALVKKYE